MSIAKRIQGSLDGLNFTVNTDKSYNNGIEKMIKTPIELVKNHMNVAANALKSLDALINFEDDDDDDLLRNIESYKNTIRQKKMEKQAAEKSKLDEAPSSDNSFNEISKSLENGALVHDTERKKISLKLKPTLNLKQQQQQPPKEINESFVDTQPNESQAQKMPNDNNKQTNEQQSEQAERHSRERSASVRKKSGQRKDERKSRRSEDRASRRSEERNRSRRSDEDRRNRRSEEKRLKRSEERRSRRSEDRRSRRSEDRRSKRSEEKRSRRSEERRSKRRHDRSPASPVHYRDSYYSPSYRNRSMSPLPRGPRTPPNTPPPNSTEFDDFRGNDEIAMRHMPYGVNPVVPPSAHYQPGPNQFSTSNLPPNVPNYMNEYAAYMHPNRVPVPQQYNRPPPSIHAPPPGMIPVMGANNEFYYHNPLPPSHLSNQAIPPNSFSNLIEVSPYGVPNSLNVDCIRKLPENRRKPTNAVQKGNVLEIVPSAEPHSDKNIDPLDIERSDKMSLIDKQHQQALQRQKQERLKRKMERHQKRLDRNKRKEFLLTEISRMSHMMMFGDDRKVMKAGEALKTMKFDGNSIKTKETDGNEEEIYVEPQIYSYDPQAMVGRSILSERNDAEKISTPK